MNDRPTARAWVAAALVASVLGGAATVAFAVGWFARVRGLCGVPRFYEQAFGALVVVGWLAGTALGLWLALAGRRGEAEGSVGGCVIAILANVAAVAVCAHAAHGVRASDYTLQSAEQLLGHLSGNDLDARKLSAHVLGERRAVEAVSPLRAILDDAKEDLDLRHNAAIALGRICAAPRPDGVDVAGVTATLTRALESRDEYLAHSVLQALGAIGDVRTVSAVAEFLCDGSRPTHAREEAARALGNIGGGEAEAALEKALPDAADDSLATTIRRAISRTRRPRPGESRRAKPERQERMLAKASPPFPLSAPLPPRPRRRGRSLASSRVVFDMASQRLAADPIRLMEERARRIVCGSFEDSPWRSRGATRPPRCGGESRSGAPPSRARGKAGCFGDSAARSPRTFSIAVNDRRNGRQRSYPRHRVTDICVPIRGWSQIRFSCRVS